MKPLPWFALLLCLPLLAGADSDTDRWQLGRVELPVPERTISARREALREGLDRVLVRLTGSTDLAELSALDSLRAGDPSRWVSQYSYEDAPDDEQDGSSDDSDDEDADLILRMRFDVEGLLERLGELNAPVWDERRPAVLVWLVVQEPVSGELLARDSEHRVRTLLMESARRRGLPIVLPRMDSEDRDTIGAADIRGRFDEPLREASTRYDTDLVASAVLYTGNPNQLRWRLLDGGEERTGDTLTAVELELGIQDWVDRLTDHLVDLYVVRGERERNIRIRVKDLARLQDWNRLQNFLDGLAGMRDIELRHLQGRTAEFSARFAGPVTRLERLAKLQPGLQSCDDERALAAVSARKIEPADIEAADEKETEVEDTPSLEFCWGGSG